MAELHLCDLMLLKVGAETGCSIPLLAQRERAVLADLTRLLPRLLTLQFGEIDARVVPDADCYRLRLLLRPRQRNLLVGPSCARITLAGEADLLRTDIQKAGLQVMRAAREARRRPTIAPPADRDLMHELLVRRARQAWRFVVEHQQIELPFPECPRYFEDEQAHRVEGVVESITEHLVVVRGAEIRTLDASPHVVARLGHLGVEINPAASSPAAEGARTDVISCGRHHSQLVRLRRCVLTLAVIGAVEVVATA
jgi:hypothetical protein